MLLPRGHQGISYQDKQQAALPRAVEQLERETLLPLPQKQHSHSTSPTHTLVPESQGLHTCAHFRLHLLGYSAHGHAPNPSPMAALQASLWWALGSPLLGNTQLLRPQSFWDPRSAHISDTNATSTTRALVAVPYAKMDPFNHNTLHSREKDQEVPRILCPAIHMSPISLRSMSGRLLYSFGGIMFP